MTCLMSESQYACWCYSWLGQEVQTELQGIAIAVLTSSLYTASFLMISMLAACHRLDYCTC
jgi:hypothetical protein